MRRRASLSSRRGNHVRAGPILEPCGQPVARQRAVHHQPVEVPGAAQEEAAAGRERDRQRDSLRTECGAVHDSVAYTGGATLVDTLVSGS